MSFKNNSFSDRAKASAEAKQALLSKFKPKPTVQDPDLEARKAAEREALEKVRAERAAEREVRRAEREEAERIRREEEAITAEARELALRAAQKAARDARYAARKQKRK